MERLKVHSSIVARMRSDAILRLFTYFKQFQTIDRIAKNELSRRRERMQSGQKIW